jgi:hypothetical protein
LPRHRSPQNRRYPLPRAPVGDGLGHPFCPPRANVARVAAALGKGQALRASVCEHLPRLAPAPAARRRTPRCPRRGARLRAAVFSSSYATLTAWGAS